VRRLQFPFFPFFFFLLSHAAGRNRCIGKPLWTRLDRCGGVALLPSFLPLSFFSLCDSSLETEGRQSRAETYAGARQRQRLCRESWRSLFPSSQYGRADASARLGERDGDDFFSSLFRRRVNAAPESVELVLEARVLALPPREDLVTWKPMLDVFMRA